VRLLMAWTSLKREEEKTVYSRQWFCSRSELKPIGLHSNRMRAAENVFVGIPGPELDALTSALLAEHRPGGIVLFGRNVKSPEQLHELVAALRRVLPEAVLAIDAEGGRVDRLQDVVGPAPSGAALARNPPALAQQAGTWVAHALRLFDL